MIYIKHEAGKATFTHYMPFDEQHGLGKTEMELKKEGILVDALPDEENRPGFAAVLNVNPEDNTLFYTYEEIPPLSEESAQAEIAALKASQEQQDELIMTLMLGGM